MVRYYSSGDGRDSYITGVRPSGKYGELHDVSKRRDNLPENVYNSLREGVFLESRMRLNDEEARANSRLLMASGKGGKRTTSSTNGGAKQALEAMDVEAQTAERHTALAELYAREACLWDELLGYRGLVAERPMHR